MRIVKDLIEVIEKDRQPQGGMYDGWLGRYPSRCRAAIVFRLRVRLGVRQLIWEGRVRREVRPWMSFHLIPAE